MGNMLKIFGLGVLAVGGLVMAAGQAQASGCNGHVNVAEWGCAPWDNNNGPQFPHYQKPGHNTYTQPGHNAYAAPPAHIQPHNPPPSVVGRNNGNGLIGHDGGSLIGHDGGSFTNSNGAGTIAQGGGNVVGPGGASMRH
jgi:hypothetical protein